jgi:hypothetical protein
MVKNQARVFTVTPPMSDRQIKKMEHVMGQAEQAERQRTETGLPYGSLKKSGFVRKGRRHRLVKSRAVLFEAGKDDKVSQRKSVDVSNEGLVDTRRNSLMVPGKAMTGDPSRSRTEESQRHIGGPGVLKPSHFASSSPGKVEMLMAEGPDSEIFDLKRGATQDSNFSEGDVEKITTFDQKSLAPVEITYLMRYRDEVPSNSHSPTKHRPYRGESPESALPKISSR